MSEVSENELIIRNEEDALNLLRDLVEGRELEPGVQLRLDGWPVLVIRIEGRDFHGTVPTRIMPSLLKLQSEVNRLYSLIRYGDETSRRLTKADREQLELVVKVDDGSSWYETLLQEPLLKVFTDAAARMTPEQLTITIIAFGLFVTSHLSWRTYLRYRDQEQARQSSIELSRVELEKQRLLVEATRNNNDIKLIHESINEFKTELLRKVKADDTVTLPDNHDPSQNLVIPGEYALEVTKNPRNEPVEEFIEGSYVIYSVIFNDDNLRLELIDTQGEMLKVIVPDGALNAEQREYLKNNSFRRSPMHMHLLVRRRNGNIINSSLISIADNDLQAR